MKKEIRILAAVGGSAKAGVATPVLVAKAAENKLLLDLTPRWVDAPDPEPLNPLANRQLYIGKTLRQLMKHNVCNIAQIVDKSF